MYRDERVGLNAHKHRLAMADAMIWQTAVANQTVDYTQDADFFDLPYVVYQPRPKQSK